MKDFLVVEQELRHSARRVGRAESFRFARSTSGEAMLPHLARMQDRSRPPGACWSRCRYAPQSGIGGGCCRHCWDSYCPPRTRVRSEWRRWNSGHMNVNVSSPTWGDVPPGVVTVMFTVVLAVPAGLTAVIALAALTV